MAVTEFIHQSLDIVYQLLISNPFIELRHRNYTRPQIFCPAQKIYEKLGPYLLCFGLFSEIETRHSGQVYYIDPANISSATRAKFQQLEKHFRR